MEAKTVRMVMENANPGMFLVFSRMENGQKVVTFTARILSRIRDKETDDMKLEVVDTKGTKRTFKVNKYLETHNEETHAVAVLKTQPYWW
jgi:hypothetical protein